MLNFLSPLGLFTPRRRVPGRRLGCRPESLENLTLLSAHAFRHHAVAAEVSVAKATPAKGPADFNGSHELFGQLDGQSAHGSATVTQTGSSASVLLSFDGRTDFDNFAMNGTVKGRKLTAEYHGNQNGISDAFFQLKLKKNGNTPWRLSWNDVTIV
ncbi:MAG: hypothetical protein U0903_21590 [Planctomycetales bacterium]